MHIYFSYSKMWTKHVYISVIQSYEQEIRDTLILAEVVLDQFSEDFSAVDVVYSKLDNAGSYHWNYCLKALYNICKNKNITLLRYDFNEPCCGKYQCHR